MSTLAELTAAGRSDLLPGYTISRFSLAAFGEAEQEFASRHIANAARSTIGLPSVLADKVIAAATNDVASGKFSYGMEGFDNTAFAMSSLPATLTISLRIKDKKLTRQQAADLLTPENETEVRRAVLRAMGYKLAGDPDPNAGAGTTPPPPPPSTGEKSSASSASEGSATNSPAV